MHEQKIIFKFIFCVFQTLEKLALILLIHLTYGSKIFNTATIQYTKAFHHFLLKAFYRFNFVEIF